MTDRRQLQLHQADTQRRVTSTQEAPLSTRGGRRSQSFLVRVWVEPREVAGEACRVRTYVRDLRTGEESYLDDPSELTDHLSRQVEEIQGTPPLLRNGTDGDATLE